MLSHFSRIQLFVTSWTVAHQAPLSMEFSRQEYWGGLPCLPPGDLPNPGIEPGSLMTSALAGEFFTNGVTKSRTRLSHWTELSWTPWKPNVVLLLHRIVEINMENSQEYLHIKHFLKLLNSPKDTVMFLNLYIKNSIEKILYLFQSVISSHTNTGLLLLLLLSRFSCVWLCATP